MLSPKQIPSQALTTIALMGLVVWVFYPATAFDYINFDDDLYITQNPMVLGGLSWEGLSWAFTTHHGGHWHPLSWLAHMAAVEFLGPGPAAHHALNITVHALNALLVAWALVLLHPKRPQIALAVALLFALHPLRLESVVWACQLKDVLSAFLGLATIVIYLHGQKHPAPWRFGLMFGVYALALLAKPTVVVLPWLIWLCELAQKSVTMERLRQSFQGKKALLAMSMLGGFWTITAQGQEGALNSLSESTLIERLGRIPMAYTSYLERLFHPGPQSIFHPQVAPHWGLALGGFVLLLGITAAAILLRRQRPYVLCGWTWFALGIFPVAGILQVGGQFISERWTYLPHLGLIYALVLALWDIFDRPGSSANPFTAVVHTWGWPLSITALVVLCAVETRQELPHWQNSETIFAHALEADPNNFMAHTNLGSALDRRGLLDEAAIHYKAALRANPTYPEAQNNMGSLLARRGEVETAQGYFRQALKRRPSFVAARYNLVLTLHHQGNLDAALENLLRVLAQNPNYGPANETFERLLQRQIASGCAWRPGANTLAMLRARHDLLSRDYLTCLGESKQ